MQDVQKEKSHDTISLQPEAIDALYLHILLYMYPVWIVILSTLI